MVLPHIELGTVTEPPTFELVVEQAAIGENLQLTILPQQEVPAPTDTRISFMVDLITDNLVWGHTEDGRSVRIDRPDQPHTQAASSRVAFGNGNPLTAA